jgi:hypothetical protein
MKRQDLKRIVERLNDGGEFVFGGLRYARARIGHGKIQGLPVGARDAWRNLDPSKLT